MRRLALLLTAGAFAAAGCQMEKFRSQPLGQADYAKAFEAGKAVLGQYFSIASADPASGKIVTRPRSIEARPDRLLGSSPAREVAVMQIRSRDKEVHADLRVEIQRQDVGAGRMMQPVTVDTELPSRTPAQESGAVLPEQDQPWETTGRDHALERTILGDLLRRLTESR